MKTFFVIICVLSLMVGCSTFDSHQKSGYLEFERAQEMLPPITEDRVIYLKYLRIEIKKDNIQMSRQFGVPVMGLANKRGIIKVVGKQKGYKIWVNPAVLGHELMHLMNWDDDEFYHPDDD